MAAQTALITVPPDIFIDLYERVLAEFNIAVPSDLPKPLTIRETEVALREAIESAPAVTPFINEINIARNPSHSGGFHVEVHNTLYGNYGKAKKGQEVKVNRIALTCFARYITNDKQMTWEKFIEKQEREKPGLLEYHGYFYSFYQHKILKFSLWANLSSKDIQVEVQGLHQEEYVDIKYKGRGRKKNNFIFIDLTANRDGYEDELKFIVYTGNVNEPSLMLALFMGISTRSCPMAGEVVLVKSGRFDAIDIVSIKRYLMLKCSRIRIRNVNFGDPSDLRVKGQPVSLVQNMVGSYWVWNFDGHGNIMQSKYEIKDDYTSYFYTKAYGDNENDQVCLLSISNVVNRRLCMSSHPKEGTGVIAYVILNTTPSHSPVGQIYIGVFCSVGQNGRNPVSGKIVLMRAGPRETISPATISKSNIKVFLDKKPKLNFLYEKLKEVTRRGSFENEK